MSRNWPSEVAAERVRGGSAILPAAHASGVDSQQAGEPLTVHGVALTPGVTSGRTKSGEKSVYSVDVLEAAADKLVGRKIVDDTEHDDLEATEPPNKTIIGEVTAASYSPEAGGLAFEGEVDREPERSLIENGRVEVSPTVFRQLGEYDQARGARRVEKIAHFRDLAVVPAGAADGVEVAAGASPVAMSAEALAATFGTSDYPTANSGVVEQRIAALRVHGATERADEVAVQKQTDKQ